MPEPSASTITWKATISFRAAAIRAVRPSHAALPFASGLLRGVPRDLVAVADGPDRGDTGRCRSRRQEERERAPGDRPSHRTSSTATVAGFPLTSVSAAARASVITT